MAGYIVIAIVVFLIATLHLILRRQKKDLEFKISVLNKAIEDNQKILFANKAILGRVEIGAFQVRESMLWMYTYYRDLSKILQKVEPHDKEALMKANTMAMKGMAIMAEKFTGTFNVTPEQYLSNKIKMTYTNREGQSFPAPNASVN